MIVKKSNVNSIKLCANMLQEEKVLILPTDTIYGISGVVNKTQERIFNIKGRESDKKLITLISSPLDIYKITSDFIPKNILSLWPAPLTIIVHSKTTPEETIAVRCPKDKWLRQVIKECGSPIYSTSVNISGYPSLTSISTIIEEFENKVDLIVDAGDNKKTLPSTIIAISKEKDRYKVKIIRQGEVKIDITTLKEGILPLPPC